MPSTTKNQMKGLKVRAPRAYGELVGDSGSGPETASASESPAIKTLTPPGRVIRFSAKVAGKSSRKVGVPEALIDKPDGDTPRGRGRPAINPIRAKPTIKAKDLLPRERLANSVEMRPVIWQDLPRFAVDHSRTSMEMMYDLGFNTTFQYTSSAVVAEVVPFDVELLLRIYMKYPSSCKWVKPSPAQALELLYGDLIDPYRGNTESEASIRMALGGRFAAYLDRSVTVLYRWLTDKGASSRRVVNILSKMEEMGSTPQERRAEFEGIANQAWKFRGVDMEYSFPLPTGPGNPRYMKDWVRASVVGVGDTSNKSYQPGAFG